MPDRPRAVSRYTQSRSTANRVYETWQQGSTLPYAEDNRTESNCIRTGKSEAEVTSKKLRSRYCTTEARLNTDRHKATRGLFATAELLVDCTTPCARPILRCVSVRPSVMLVYQTFSPSGCSAILVFFLRNITTKPRRIPLTIAVLTDISLYFGYDTRQRHIYCGTLIEILRRYHSIDRVNYAIYRMVSFSMTLSDA